MRPYGDLLGKYGPMQDLSPAQICEAATEMKDFHQKPGRFGFKEWIWDSNSSSPHPPKCPTISLKRSLISGNCIVKPICAVSWVI